MTGLQAVEMVQAGLKAIYCSGWQVAADANFAVKRTRTRVCIRGQCAEFVNRINNAFSARIRFSIWRARKISIGLRRLWRTQRQGSAAI